MDEVQKPIDSVIQHRQNHEKAYGNNVELFNTIYPKTVFPLTICMVLHIHINFLQTSVPEYLFESENAAGNSSAASSGHKINISSFLMTAPSSANPKYLGTSVGPGK
jgi:hypothetical protein